MKFCFLINQFLKVRHLLATSTCHTFAVLFQKYVFNNPGFVWGILGNSENMNLARNQEVRISQNQIGCLCKRDYLILLRV